MKRSARVFLNDLNQGKAEELGAFLYLCHDVLQYFTDVFWARGEMTAKFADLETVHLATNRFGITTRLSQGLAKQAMEIVASQRKKPTKERKKPALRRHVVTPGRRDSEFASGIPRVFVLFVFFVVKWVSGL